MKKKTKIAAEFIVSLDDVYDLGQLKNKGANVDINISQTAKFLGCSRDKVRDVFNGKLPSNKRNRSRYLDDYKQVIISLLNDRNKQFEYLDHLYKYLLDKNVIDCAYSTFTKYMREDEELKHAFGKQTGFGRFTERFETAQGEQAQFDLKERMTVVLESGEKVKVPIATLTLGWSRYNVRMLTLSNTLEEVLSFLAYAFEHIGGVPETIVFDNLKSVVNKPKTKDKPAEFNERFLEFANNYNFIPYGCAPYRPQTKGKTETQNKVPGRLYNYNGEYKDLYEVCERLGIISKEDNSNISQATGFPSVFLLEKEKSHLKTLPCQEIRKEYYLQGKPVAVTNEALFTYQKRKYSVPKEFIGLKVQYIVKGKRLQVYYNNDLITVHEITNEMLNIKPEHDLKYKKELEVNVDETIDNDKKMKVFEGLQYDNL